MDFKNKYLKYKKKYLDLKSQIGKGNCGEPCYNPGDIVENKETGEVFKVIENKYVGRNVIDHQMANKDGNYVYKLHDAVGKCFIVKEEKLKSTKKTLLDGQDSFISYIGKSLVSGILPEICEEDKK
jgi:hypothetical protein